MSSDERRKLSDDERSLWGRITRSVAPLRRKVPAAPTAAESTAKTLEHAPAARLRAPSNPAKSISSKSAPPLELLDRRLKQRLARGTVEINARLDLHGSTQSEAHVALLRFLREAQANGARFVLVITGKGTRSGNDRSERGVLKRQVPLWLRQPEFRAYVSGFEEAHVGHGGKGALYVRLRRASTK